MAALATKASLKSEELVEGEQTLDAQIASLIVAHQSQWEAAERSTAWLGGPRECDEKQRGKWTTQIRYDGGALIHSKENEDPIKCFHRAMALGYASLDKFSVYENSADHRYVPKHKCDQWTSTSVCSEIKMNNLSSSYAALPLSDDTTLYFVDQSNMAIGPLITIQRSVSLLQYYLLRFERAHMPDEIIRQILKLNPQDTSSAEFLQLHDMAGCLNRIHNIWTVPEMEARLTILRDTGAMPKA